MPIPPDYVERVYAGVLGKIIGVYLGRPFEGWTYQQITSELGEIDGYVHAQLGKALIVPDDDISGTFTFLRALADYGYTKDLTPAQIGQTWLNYIIENRTILWWGGLGNSTEHTAFLRLMNGIEAPLSGSIALNGRVVAEQIGAQIFIDGWGMVAPGEPDLAADLSARAASVSHAGEAVYGAQVIAAMEAQAFYEKDIARLIATGLSFIPQDSLIYRMVCDLQDWHAGESDWRKARELLEAHYGYDKFGGNCHIIPNHGLIHLSLLYGEGDFSKTMKIVNTSGWDTDCNSGNAGCLMGIKNGLAGFEGSFDWRAPVADRLYLPTADGGRAITDAVREAYQIARAGWILAGHAPECPKSGARFHFELPGAVQGFQVEPSPEGSSVFVQNVAGFSRAGKRSLAIRFTDLPAGQAARVSTPTFIPPGAVKEQGYSLLASPSLYPGQTLTAEVTADPQNTGSVRASLFVNRYGEQDRLTFLAGPASELEPGRSAMLSWRLEAPSNEPIAAVGLEICAGQPASSSVYLDYLTWDGDPDLLLTRPYYQGTMWQRAWVSGVDHFLTHAEPFRLVHDHGTGLLIQGTREWRDYRLSADVTPHLVTSAGIAARVQGMKRYYALLLHRDGKLRLVKALDGETLLGEIDFPWEFGTTYQLELEVRGNRLRGTVDGQPLFNINDDDHPLKSGAIALVCAEGRTATQHVRVQPTERQTTQREQT